MSTQPRNPVFLLFSMLLVLVGAGLAGANVQAASRAAEQTQSYTGVLTGTITEAASGLPLAGIEVCAVGNSDGSYRCTQSGPDGVYAFTGLPTGNYSVGIDQDGWAFETYGGGVDYDYYDATHIQLIDSQTVSGIDIALDPGGTVSGRVTDTEGNPLEGVQVRVGGWKEYLTCTDSDGYYSVSGIVYQGFGFAWMEASVDSACPNSLPAYAVEYWEENSYFQDYEMVQFTRAAPVLNNIDFTLELGGSISGTVTSETSGESLDGIPVCAGYNPGDYRFCASTETDGTYTIEGLSTYAEYAVRVLAEGWGVEIYNPTYDFIYTPVSVTAGQDTPGVDFALEPGGSISGTVFGPDDQPLEGVWIKVAGFNTYSDASGAYRVGSVPYKEYDFYTAEAWAYDIIFGHTYAPEYWRENPWYPDELYINSETPDFDNIDFTLEDLGTITGTLRASSGEALADQMVCCEGNHFGHECAYTDSYGNFSLNVGYDYFYVYAWDRESNYVYYDNPETPGDRDQVVVENGEVVSGIDLILDPCFQASDGTLLNEVALDWCIAAGVDNFEVYRTPPDGEAGLIGITPEITYTDVTAAPGIRYTYQIKACFEGACSEFSAPDSGWSNATVGPGEYDDSFNLIGYEGVWDVLSGEPYSNGSLHQAYNHLNKATLFFEGSCVSVYYVTQDTYGKLKIYIDDVFMGEYLQYDAEPLVQMQTELVCVNYDTHELMLVPWMGDPMNIDGIRIEDYRYKYFVPLLP